MINKLANYKYIWNVLQDYIEDDEKRKRIKFVVPENGISAYFEINNDELSNNDTNDDNVPVNPFLRFNELILEMSEFDSEREKTVKKVLNNLYFHLFGNLDLLEGMNAYDIILSFIVKDIKEGEFGKSAKSYISYLDRNEQRTVAKYLKKYYEEDTSINIFLRVFQEIFSDSIIYGDKIKKKTLVLYINADKSKENKMKVKLLAELFIPIDYKIKIMWQYHIGVIDVKETLKMEEMSVY